MADLNDILVQKLSPENPTETRTKEISVTAIGSCRILGPLRKMAAQRQMTLNQSGVTGYAHSCTEVLQHLAHLQAGTTPPEKLLPVISPSSPKNRPQAERHQPSDFYVFELSSAKILTVDGTAVQLNYIKRHFAEFFSDIVRERAFWAHAKNPDAAAMDNFLSREAEFTKLNTDDQYILQNLRMELVSFDQLCHDIADLDRRAPNNLFVTHFDAVDKNGEPLKARTEFVKMLRQALNECCVNWFDPSPLVSECGQAVALDDQTGSLTHYSEEFEGVLANNWWHRHISPAATALRQNEPPAKQAHDTGTKTIKHFENLTSSTT